MQALEVGINLPPMRQATGSWRCSLGLRGQACCAIKIDQRRITAIPDFAINPRNRFIGYVDPFGRQQNRAIIHQDRRAAQPHQIDKDRKDQFEKRRARRLGLCLEGATFGFLRGTDAFDTSIKLFGQGAKRVGIHAWPLCRQAQLFLGQLPFDAPVLGNEGCADRFDLLPHPLAIA